MEKVNGVGEEIIIEVFVEVEHKVETDLSGVHHLLDSHTDFLDITVLVEALNYGSAIEARHEEIDVAGGLPGLLCNDDLSLVIDVVDGSGEGLSGLVAEGVEDGDWAHVEVLDHLIVPCETVLGILEPKLGLPHGLGNSIENVVIVDDSISVATVGFLVAVADQHKLTGFCLPKVGKTEGEVVDSVALASCVVDANGCHGGVFASEIKVVELHLGFMLVSEPSDHGVVVGSLDGVFISPLVVLGLEFSDGLAGFGRVGVLVLVVGESESGVVEGSFLDDDELLGVIEGLNVHLCDIVEEVVVVDVSNFFIFEVDDVDFSAGDVHDDYFPFVKHGEEVDDVGIAMLEEHLAIGIHMDDALIRAGVDDL